MAEQVDKRNGNHILNKLFKMKKFDEIAKVLSTWNDRDIHKIISHSFYHFSDEEIANLLHELRDIYDPLSDPNNTVLSVFTNQGCLMSVKYIMRLKDGKSDALEYAHSEVTRLENKAKIEAETYEYDDTIPDDCYSPFELFLIEEGAPQLKYHASMYTSRAGYCDILCNEMSNVDGIIAKIITNWEIES